jgi:nucleotide-binding universal stress UspA family protein
MLPSRIVVGTDGSETASEAVRQAIELAKKLDANLHLVSAYRMPAATAMALGADAMGMAGLAPAYEWHEASPKAARQVVDHRGGGNGGRRPDHGGRPGHERRKALPDRQRPQRHRPPLSLQRLDRRYL